MRPTVVGISYRTAPVEAREQVALADEALRRAHRRLAEQTGQAVILSTCNRTEFYTLTDEPGHAQEAVAQLLREDAGVDYKALESYFYTHHEENAARHLFRVACSLDSMILGESEVLRQVREAFATATEAGTVRGPLTRLFHQALRVGKRARNETEIGRNALSVSYACVELARRTMGDLRDLRALVVGTGEAGKLAAMALNRAGVGRLTVTNRSLGPAVALAGLLGGEVAPLGRLASSLAEADIVVSCTGAPTYVLTQDHVSEAMRERAGRPLFLLDIAVPRDVAPEVASVPGVRLADIDDLEVLARSNREKREMEAGRVEAIVEEEVARFHEWWDVQDALPTVAALEREAENLRRQETVRALRRLRHLSPEDQETVEAMSRALVRKLFHKPFTTLKSQRNPMHREALEELFGLDGDGGS